MHDGHTETQAKQSVTGIQSERRMPTHPPDLPLSTREPSLGGLLKRVGRVILVTIGSAWVGAAWGTVLAGACGYWTIPPGHGAGYVLIAFLLFGGYCGAGLGAFVGVIVAAWWGQRELAAKGEEPAERK